MEEGAGRLTETLLKERIKANDADLPSELHVSAGKELNLNDLIDALQINHSSNSIFVTDATLDDTCLGKLGELLSSNTTLRGIDISYSSLSITDKGMQNLINQLVANNFTLTRLNLIGDEDIEGRISPSVFKKLNSILRRNSSLECMESSQADQWRKQLKSVSNPLRSSKGGYKECPISWLPSEILHAIFSFCETFQVLFDLKVVCYQWKEIIKNTSIITSIDFNNFPFKITTLQPPIPDRREQQKKKQKEKEEEDKEIMIKEFDNVETVSVYSSSAAVLEKFITKHSDKFKHLTHIIFHKTAIISRATLSAFLSSYCTPWNIRYLSLQGHEKVVIDDDQLPLPVFHSLTNLKYLDMFQCNLSIQQQKVLLSWLTQLRVFIGLGNYCYDTSRKNTEIGDILRYMSKLKILAWECSEDAVEIINHSESLEIILSQHWMKNKQFKKADLTVMIYPLYLHDKTTRKSFPKDLINQAEKLGIDLNLSKLFEIAIEKENKEFIEWLLEKGAKVSASSLGQCIQQKKLTLVKLLATHPIDISSESVMHTAIHAKNKHALSWLLAVGFSINVYQDRWALHTAILNCIEIVPHLLSKGARTDLIDNDTGETSVMLLTRTHPANSSNILLLQEFVARGADINAKSKRRPYNTALHTVIQIQAYDWVQPLLENGASVLIKNAAGIPPLEKAKQRSKAGKSIDVPNSGLGEAIRLMEKKLGRANPVGKKERHGGGKRRK